LDRNVNILLVAVSVVLAIVSLELICSKGREEFGIVFDVVEAVGEVEGKKGLARGGLGVEDLGVGQEGRRVLAISVGARFQFEVMGGTDVVEGIVFASGREGRLEKGVEGRQEAGLGLCAKLVVGGEGSHLYTEARKVSG
jgi:hypothetical protein